jgi:hypothetical protein
MNQIAARAQGRNRDWLAQHTQPARRSQTPGRAHARRLQAQPDIPNPDPNQKGTVPWPNDMKSFRPDT